MLVLKSSIHPSIHFLYPLNPIQGHRGAVYTLNRSPQGHTETNETNNHAHSHTLLETG